jgi:hypothetical protein
VAVGRIDIRVIAAVPGRSRVFRKAPGFILDGIAAVTGIVRTRSRANSLGGAGRVSKSAGTPGAVPVHVRAFTWDSGSSQGVPNDQADRS